MVVSPEPAVKRCRALGGGAVDRAVGPAAQHRADEALGLAVGLRAVRPGPEVADAEDATGDRVDRRAISGSIVSDHALDLDPVTAEEANGAAKERHRRPAGLIR